MWKKKEKKYHKLIVAGIKCLMIDKGLNGIQSKKETGGTATIAFPLSYKIENELNWEK